MAIVHLTTDTFDEAVAHGDALVEFWASWCGPCQLVEPILEELAEEYDGKALIAQVDVDDEGELAVRFKIRCIPTVISFRDGEVREKAYGAETKERFIGMLSRDT